MGLLAADHAGDQARHRLEHHQGRDLPARDDVVADRDLLGAAAPRRRARRRLRTVRRSAPARVRRRARARGPGPASVRPARAGACVAPRTERLDRGEHRLGLHHHPGPAAVGLVVDLAMLVGREVTQVVHADVQRDRPRSPCPSRLSRSGLSKMPGKIVTTSIRTARRLARGSRHHGTWRCSLRRRQAGDLADDDPLRRRRPRSTITSWSTGISVSTPSSSTADQTSFAAVWITSRTVPSARPVSVSRAQPTIRWSHHDPSGSSGDSGLGDDEQRPL